MYNDSSSSPTLTNCVFWNTSGKEIEDVNSNSSVTYCVVKGRYAGTGNIQEDPKLKAPWG